MFSTRHDEAEKLWYGPDISPLYNPNINMAQALLNAMSIFGPKIAQINDDSGIRMTYDEIRVKTIRAAQNLQLLGYQRKQVFGIIARNSHHVAPIFFASIANGCPINPLDPSFGKAEIIHMLSITKPVLMFCDIACYELLCECLKELKNEAKIFTFGGQKGQSEPVENLFVETHKEHEFIPVKVDGSNDTVCIICSSGTTGLPKGVCLSHAAFLDGMNQYNLTNCNDTMLCFSSLYWLSGVVTLLRGTISGSTRLISTELFTPERQLRLIERYRVTHTLNATHQIVLLTKLERFNETDLSSWNNVVVGGSKVRTKAELLNRIPTANITVGYGMSELACAVTLDYPAVHEKDTIGRLIAGCCVKIVDDNGKRCGVDVDGEICIKMNYKFLGYFGNQKGTEEFFDKENFMKTGDIGHFDNSGDLFIVDRKKELLKYCNFQISPSEIDSYLIESPEIKSVCVVGIPDPVTTDLPAAVIVRTEGSKITEKGVCDMVADHFADHYKLRGGVYFVESLPTTYSGKIQRKQVKEIAIELFNKCRR